MKGNKMSYVYKPIDLVELESNYNSYVVFGTARGGVFVKNAKELKQLIQQCDEGDDELLIYALQSVARAEKVNGSDDDDYDNDDDDNTHDDSGDTTTDINKTIDEITQTFNSSLKAIISKIK